MITPHITLLWYADVMRRVLEMRVEGVRARDRPKQRWSDCVTEDMKEKNLEGADVRDGRKGRKEVVNVDPPRLEWEKTKRKKKPGITLQEKMIRGRLRW